MTKKLPVFLCVLALGAFGISACGDDDEEEAAPTDTKTEQQAPDGAPPAGKAETISVSAEPDGSFAFQEESLSVDSGPVSFEFDNPAQLVHDFCVEDPNGNDIGCTDQITKSQDELTVDLEPGKYEFYCSVAGHREGGMEGPLTVK